MKPAALSVVFVPLISWLAGAPAFGAEPEPLPIAEVQRSEPVSFTKDVLPILQGNCLACHNASDAESDFVAESVQSLKRGGYQGPAIVPGNSADSLLLAVAAHQAEPFMPPPDNDVGAQDLTSSELGLIKLWIDQGAQGGDVPGTEPLAWQALPAGINPVYAVAVSDDGQYAAAGRANQIFLYHLASQRRLDQLTDPALSAQGLYEGSGAAHHDLVQSLAMSTDGSLLASGGYRTIKIWRREIAGPTLEMKGLGESPRALAVSSDGKLAAISDTQGSIRLVDTASGREVRRLEGHSAEVTDVCFAPDNGLLVSTSVDRTARFWHVAGGELRQTLSQPIEPHAAAWLGPHRVAVASADRVVRIWKWEDQKDAGAPPTAPELELKGHAGAVTALTVLGSERTMLISASDDGTARLWESSSGKEVRQFNHGGPIVALAGTGDGSKLATIGSNHVVKIWDAANGKELHQLRGTLDSQLQLQQQTQALGLADQLLTLAKTDLEEADKLKQAEQANLKSAEETLAEAEQDLQPQREAATKAEDEHQTTQQKVTAGQQALDQLKQVAAATAGSVDGEAIDKQEQLVKQLTDMLKKQAEVRDKAAQARQSAEAAAESARRRVALAKEAVARSEQQSDAAQAAVHQAEKRQQEADTALKQLQQQVAQAAATLYDGAFSPDGRTLAVASDRLAIQLWDVASGAPLYDLQQCSGPIVGVAFGPAGDIVSLSRQGTLRIQPAEIRWTLQRTVGGSDDATAPVDRVTALDFSSDGGLLASGGGEPSRSGQLQIWSVADGQLVRDIPAAHSDTIFDVAFSPDDQQLATCAADRFARIFQVSDGSLVRTLEGHTHHVLSSAWRADGRVLATAGADKVIKVWDTRSGEQQRTIEGFSREVTGVAFVGLGSEVAASSADGTAALMNSANGRNVRSFSGQADFLHCLDTPSDGRWIVAGGQDSLVRLWTSDGKQSAVLGE